MVWIGPFRVSGTSSNGDSSPVLVDLNGDNRNELVVATSDGWVHAYRANGSELPGWPVHTAPQPLHRGDCVAIPSDLRMSVDPESTIDLSRGGVMPRRK